RVEARAVAQLQHPHIVPLLEFGEHEGQPFFTMRFISGGSLDQLLARNPLAPRDAVALMVKLASAIQHAHEKGILHRHLKPGDSLLDEEGEPLISEFGLAKFLEVGEDETKTGQMVGAPAYMAPEQAAGEGKHATTASDIWSLGVILFELLTGKRPFEG